MTDTVFGVGDPKTERTDSQTSGAFELMNECYLSNQSLSFKSPLNPSHLLSPLESFTILQLEVLSVLCT